MADPSSMAWSQGVTRMRVTPRERALIEALRADPLQHEHVVQIHHDESGTVQHPVEERFVGELFDCPVLETVLDWVVEHQPEPGRYRYVEENDGSDYRLEPL